MNFFEELKWRGLVKDVAGDDIADKLNNEKVTFYWGTDPTADSLHLGHYSSLVTAKRLAKAGVNRFTDELTDFFFSDCQETCKSFVISC